MKCPSRRCRILSPGRARCWCGYTPARVAFSAASFALAGAPRATARTAPIPAHALHPFALVMRVDRHGDVSSEVHALIPGGVDVALDFVGGQAGPAAMASLRGGGHY